MADKLEFVTFMETGYVRVEIPPGSNTWDQWDKKWLLEWFELVVKSLRRRWIIQGAALAPANPKEEVSVTTDETPTPAPVEGATPSDMGAPPPTQSIDVHAPIPAEPAPPSEVKA